MVRSTMLVASMASVALGSVANFCAQEPFRQMQDFRDFQPAIDRCALHYSAATIVKTLPNTCLTSTKTVILGTNTVHATSTMACPTVTSEPHIEMRDASALEPRAEEYGPEGYGEGHHGHHPHHHGHHHGHHGHHRGHHGHHRGHHGHHPHHHHHHHPHHHHPHHPPHYPHSKPPHYYAEIAARAGPTPVAVFKRDAEPTKTAEWSSYYASLAECGYNCIQTACSCVGTPIVQLKTPAPTCTSVLTKETVVAETTTIEVTPTSC